MLEHPSTESEVDFVSDNYDDELPNFSSPDSNIPSLSQPSPQNTSKEVGISQEGDQSEPKHKYQRKCQRKQWPKLVWKRGSDGKMKCVELKKNNRHIYALTFGTHTILPMVHKFSKKRMRFNYKQYKRSISDNGNILLQSMPVGY